MHLVEKYALDCGVKISRPFILDTYFPLPFEKYVLIHAGGGMGAKIYEYYNDVVSLLRDVLKTNGYEIVQIGGAEDPSINGIVNLKGATNIHQTAYLIKNAALLIGNDSCNVHIASGYDIPIVSLYGPTTTYNHGPYFSSEGKTKLLVADLEGNKPSYKPQESPKTINKISPEEVAKSVLELLGISHQINFQTVYVGEKFNAGGLDLIPNFLLPPNVAQNTIPQVRMDYLFNEEGLAANLNVRKQVIVTDKAINLSLIAKFKPNIEIVLFEVKEDSSPDFIAGLKKLGIKYVLYSSLTEEKLGKAKIDFFDYGIILERKYSCLNSVRNNPLITGETQFKTNKFLIANGQIYLSKSHWVRDQPVKSFSNNVGTILLDDDFLKFSEYYYLFNK